MAPVQGGDVDESEGVEAVDARADSGSAQEADASTTESDATTRDASSDQDVSAPGVTPQAPAGQTAAAVNQLLLEYAVTFKDGTVDSYRMHSLREERTQCAACLNIAITDARAIGNNVLCPSGSTQLIPARPDVTCAELDPEPFDDPVERPAKVDCRAQQR